MQDNLPNSSIASTLQRLAESNPHRATGPGIQPGHYVPLCQYYNRKLAAKLCLRLDENGIGTKTESTRLFVAVSVDAANCDQAIRILNEFKASNPDTRPSRFSRDYDVVFLIFFATSVLAFASLVTRKWSVPIGVAISGASLCFVAERLHRQKRYHEAMHFTLLDLFGITSIFGVNFAIWRYVLSF